MKGWNGTSENLREDKTHESEKNVSKCLFTIPTLHGENANWKVFLLFFPGFSKEIQAKINELESEMDKSG